MLDYFKHKSTIYSFLSDMIILSGVIAFQWNMSRILTLLFIDVEFMIIFFFIFLVRTKDIWEPFSFLLGLFILSALLFVYFRLMMPLSRDLVIRIRFGSARP